MVAWFLPAIPWIVEGLIGTAVVGTAHVVTPGREEREESMRQLGNAIAGIGRDDAAMMEQANEGAEENAAQGDAVDACTTCDPPPECQEAAGDVKEGLYQNKRLPGATGGFHGYLNRMVEQMCGAHGPGTVGFNNHIQGLQGAFNRVKGGVEKMNRARCNPAQLLSRKERLVINNILSRRIGWTPETISWKGRDHPDCLNFTNLRDTGNLGDLLRIIRPGL
ncbi:hypothetical protein OSJ77_03165 [Phyllobacterium sp. 0TCS1.6C]|uniref:hypothetical protein n=1 Tax=unclassified Phyllobacterium TaxID=2638441 RepID=UPI002264291F|nr:MULTISPECIES: hypothetical protein [unclassified Phyllobacterium]MCX8279179.1 hypothetical protein [Phyllobacterium sp. 0TCS1.6C]MCX8293963.1 hypothetical protein [Phyllobacterium sp. 0TCS1.6A]